MKSNNYRPTVLIIQKEIIDCDNLISTIKNNTNYRVIVYDNMDEFINFSGSRKADIILTDQNCCLKISETKWLELVKTHQKSCFTIIYKQPLSDDLLNKLEAIDLCQLLPKGFSHKELLFSLTKANNISKLSLKTQTDDLVIKKMQCELTHLHKDNTLYIKQELEEKRQNFKLDNNNNKFSTLFKEINNFELNKISSILEKKLSEILDLKKFSIFLMTESYSNLQLFASKNFNMDKSIVLSLEDIIEKSIMFDSIYSRKHIYLKDFTTSKFNKRKKENKKYIQKDCLCIPLISGNKIIGVANFNDSKFDYFTQKQVDQIIIFCNYLAVLIDNIRNKKTV